MLKPKKNLTYVERRLLEVFPDETLHPRQLSGDQAAMLNHLICRLKYGRNA